MWIKYLNLLFFFFFKISKCCLQNVPKWGCSYSCYCHCTRTIAVHEHDMYGDKTIMTADEAMEMRKGRPLMLMDDNLYSVSIIVMDTIKYEVLCFNQNIDRDQSWSRLSWCNIYQSIFINDHYMVKWIGINVVTLLSRNLTLSEFIFDKQTLGKVHGLITKWKTKYFTWNI